MQSARASASRAAAVGSTSPRPAVRKTAASRPTVEPISGAAANASGEPSSVPPWVGTAAAAGSSGGANGVSASGTDADLKPLSSPDPHVRQATCQSLAKPSLRGDARVVAALLARLQDRDQYVRQAAASSLGQVSSRGDEANIAALVARLLDSDPGVRRLTSTALGQVAQRGCTEAVVPLVDRLEDRDGGVRRAACKALEKVSEKNDAQVIAGVFGLIADPEGFVRHTAVEVLSRIADEGDTEVVARLLKLLETDKDARVRWAATEALGRLAIRGDSRVLTALLGRLDDEADSVRRAAANSLGHVTFAPLQELELQERHIAEIEFRGAHEVSRRDRTIVELEDRHTAEVTALQQRITELEENKEREINARDVHIASLEEKSMEQVFFSRVPEFIPNASHVTRFLDTLPAMASPSSYGTEIIAPVWALRCMRATGPEPGARGHGAGRRGSSPTMHAWHGEDGSATEGKERRWLMSLFELFEQLSSGQVTPMELTDKKPLDVYVHRGDDDAWGLYCCSRHRMMALLMRQACSRNELLTVRCLVRPKDDSSFWSWQWNTFYDGSDGLTTHTSCRSGGSTMGGQDRMDSHSPTSSRLSSPHASTRRSASNGRFQRAVASSAAMPNGHAASDSGDQASSQTMGQNGSGKNSSSSLPRSGGMGSRGSSAGRVSASGRKNLKPQGRQPQQRQQQQAQAQAQAVAAVAAAVSSASLPVVLAPTDSPAEAGFHSGDGFAE